MPALEVVKQPKENNQSVIRRFTKKLKESAILRIARERMFRKREPSRQYYLSELLFQKSPVL